MGNIYKISFTYVKDGLGGGGCLVSYTTLENITSVRVSQVGEENEVRE